MIFLGPPGVGKTHHWLWVRSDTLLFDVIDMRYRKRKPIILTSNKSWGQWGEIIPDRVMATAIPDRLLHYSVTVNTAGDSYRLRQHREFGLRYINRSGKKRGECRIQTGETVASETGVGNITDVVTGKFLNQL